MKTHTWRVAALVIVLGSSLVAQVATGTPPFGSFDRGDFDQVNLENLNVHFQIPIIHKAGRGQPFAYDLSYDNTVWYPGVSGGSTVWTPMPNWGWRNTMEAFTGYVTIGSSTTSACKGRGATGQVITMSGFVYHDPSGTQHPLPGSAIDSTQCNPPVSPNHRDLHTVATDGSGLTFDYTLASFWTPKITTISGTVILPPEGTAPPGTITDRNGNYINATGSSTVTFTDTLGLAVLTVSGSGTQASPMLYKYTNPQGNLSTITVNYSNYSIKTNFGCSNVAEYTSTGTVPLVTSVVLPDQSQYTFTYEDTPNQSGYKTARISTVNLPTGGSIHYQYSITAPSCSGTSLTRTLNPGGTWTYNNNVGTGNVVTTTETTPLSGNVAVLNLTFQSSFETTRFLSNNDGTSLGTNVTCYNGITTNCNTTTVTMPITEQTATTQLTGGLQSKVDTLYNSVGLVTEQDHYGWASGAPGALAAKTVIAYASLGNNILDRPSSVTVQDGLANITSQTAYAYDEAAYPLQQTSGTPHLSSISGSRGNATTISRYLTATSALSSHAKYFDTGSLYQAQDVNATWTPTYTYGACGNSFVTNIGYALGLSESFTWDCNGGAMTSSTDVNGKHNNWTFSDPNFWRPTSSSDSLSNVTTFAYLSSTELEASMNFNGGQSTSDTLTTLDGVGHVLYQQQRQAPRICQF